MSTRHDEAVIISPVSDNARSALSVNSHDSPRASTRIESRAMSLTISIDLAELFAAPAGPAIKPTNIAAAAAMARQAPRVLGTRSSGKVSDGLIGTAVLRCGRERKNIPEITIMLQRAAANTPERERRPLSSRRRFPGASTYHAPL